MSLSHLVCVLLLGGHDDLLPASDVDEAPLCPEPPLVEVDR